MTSEPYLHNFREDGSTDEDHVLPTGRILYPNLELGQPLHVALKKKENMLRCDYSVDLQITVQLHNVKSHNEIVTKRLCY